MWTIFAAFCAVFVCCSSTPMREKRDVQCPPTRLAPQKDFNATKFAGKWYVLGNYDGRRQGGSFQLFAGYVMEYKLSGKDNLVPRMSFYQRHFGCVGPFKFPPLMKMKENSGIYNVRIHSSSFGRVMVVYTGIDSDTYVTAVTYECHVPFKAGHCPDHGLVMNILSRTSTVPDNVMSDLYQVANDLCVEDSQIRRIDQTGNCYNSLRKKRSISSNNILKDPPRRRVNCGPVCYIYCPFGNKLDRRGCPICSCNWPDDPDYLKKTRRGKRSVGKLRVPAAPLKDEKKKNEGKKKDIDAVLKGMKENKEEINKILKMLDEKQKDEYYDETDDSSNESDYENERRNYENERRNASRYESDYENERRNYENERRNASRYESDYENEKKKKKKQKAASATLR